MAKTEIFTNGSCVTQTKEGGWAAVVLKSATGAKHNTSSNEMELRAMVEAVKIAEGPCTVISDMQGLVKTAQEGRIPDWCTPLWEELYTALVEKDVTFEWRGRGNSHGQKLAHQLAKDAARRGK